MRDILTFLSLVNLEPLDLIANSLAGIFSSRNIQGPDKGDHCTSKSRTPEIKRELTLSEKSRSLMSPTNQQLWWMKYFEDLHLKN